LNAYGYVGGNPLSSIDRLGLRTAVVVDGTSGGNPFGHTSVATTGSGLYSYGTRVGGTLDLGVSLTGYLSERVQGRNISVIIINTTTEQEKAILERLQNFPYKLPPWILGRFPDPTDTCSTRTSDALGAGGMANPDPLILLGSPAFPVDVLSQAEFRRQALGGTTINLPKGTDSIPFELTEFNPQPIL